jgi:hypothetical protein
MENNWRQVTPFISQITNNHIFRIDSELQQARQPKPLKLKKYDHLKGNVSIARSEVFLEVEIQVEFFWFVTPCSVVVGYQRFGGFCCLHLQGEDGGKRGPPKLL